MRDLRFPAPVDDTFGSMTFERAGWRLRVDAENALHVETRRSSLATGPDL